VSPKWECLIVHNRRMIEITSASGFKPRRRARVLSKTDGQLSTVRAIAGSSSKVRMAAKNGALSYRRIRSHVAEPAEGNQSRYRLFQPSPLGVGRFSEDQQNLRV